MLRYFFKVARLLQALIGNGTHPKKRNTRIKKSQIIENTLFAILNFRLLFYVTFVRNNNVSGN